MAQAAHLILERGAPRYRRSMSKIAGGPIQDRDPYGEPRQDDLNPDSAQTIRVVTLTDQRLQSVVELAVTRALEAFQRAQAKITQAEVHRFIGKPTPSVILGSHAAAKMARCRQQDLLRALDKGELPGEKVPRGSSYCWRIEASAVAAWAVRRK